MYKLGTGDCFVLKFFAGDDVTCRMLIDCGCWNKRTFEKIRPVVEEIRDYVGGHLDVLVVTHEHLDHVRGFQAAKKIFTEEFTVDRIWMAWSEEDGDPDVEDWKRDLGDKKIALALAAQHLDELASDDKFRAQWIGARDGERHFEMRKRFAAELQHFAELHVDETVDNYKGALKGMAVVKDDIADNNVDYFEPGDVLEDVPGLDGMRVCVLGPPQDPALIKKEHGDGDESFPHNEDLSDTDLFVHAMHEYENKGKGAALTPFDPAYNSDGDGVKAIYEADDWRRIDHDWLFNAGSLALRLNTGINNLSLVLAFEFIESGRALLFPGDAEYGSWKSWHDIEWDVDGETETVEDLLNRVVFYKVAHHLSHNGTARSIGLDMMTSPELVAMATLDYDNISKGWKSTMPNGLLLKNLLQQTRGRTLVMNLDGVPYDRNNNVLLADKIAEARAGMTAAERKAFDDNHSEEADENFIEYVLHDGG
jgi:hypothetical protein